MSEQKLPIFVMELDAESLKTLRPRRSRAYLPIVPENEVIANRFSIKKAVGWINRGKMHKFGFPAIFYCKAIKQFRHARIGPTQVLDDPDNEDQKTYAFDILQVGDLDYISTLEGGIPHMSRYRKPSKAKP